MILTAPEQQVAEKNREGSRNEDTGPPERLVPTAVPPPTCSEAHVHEVVKDDGHLAVAEGVQHRFPLQVLVPGVGRVDGHRRVSQHGLDTRGGHDHLLV